MKLSKKDRLILVHQYEILKRLDDKDNFSFYEEKIEILSNGYEIFYSELDAQIYDDMPKGEGVFVLEVLTIYDYLEVYKEQHPEDKEVGEHLWSSFKGFDGNNEGEYLGFAQFLIEKQGKFDKLASLNSHMPVIDKYRKMVRKWNESHQSVVGGFSISRDHILEMLDS